MGGLPDLHRRFRFDPVPGRDLDAHRARQAGLVGSHQQRPAAIGVAQPDLSLIGTVVVGQGEAGIAPGGPREGDAGDDLGLALIVAPAQADHQLRRPARGRKGGPDPLQVTWGQGPEGMQVVGIDVEQDQTGPLQDQRKGPGQFRRHRGQVRRCLGRR